MRNFSHASKVRSQRLLIKEDHMPSLRPFLRDESGASMAEYGLLVAVITFAMLSSCAFTPGGLQTLGQNVNY